MGKIGIVYGTQSKQIRRVILPDYDAQLDLPGWTGPGETLLVCDEFVNPQGGVADRANHEHVKQQVFAATGVMPPRKVVAVVDAQSKVESLILADPAIDSLPNKTLVEAYSPKIAAGASYDSKTGLFTTKAYTIPATTDKGGNPVPAKDVAAEVIPKP